MAANIGLYYPYINFRSDAWVKLAALYWDKLGRIPAGETRTYKQIARAVGAPDAVRAVGSACGANPVALLVPCHRAVRTDGGLGGYAWGLPRKKKLLETERKAKKR